MEKSLQAIEDSYIRKELSGAKLRKALERDREYQVVLLGRKRRLKKIKVSKKDQQRYVLSTDQDYKILGTIYQLEKKKLLPEDRRIVALIRTQLEHDWRRALLRVLKNLTEKYQSPKVKKFRHSVTKKDVRM